VFALNSEALVVKHTFLMNYFVFVTIVFCNFHYVVKIIFKAFLNRTEKTESNSKRRDFRIVCFSKKASKDGNPLICPFFVDSLFLLLRFRYCV